MKRQLVSPRAESCKEEVKESCSHRLCNTSEEVSCQEGLFRIKSVNSCPRKSNEPMSNLIFSIHISKQCVCQESVGDYRQTPNSFKLSNLFGFNDFRHLSARSRNKLARQEVNDSDIKSIGRSELRKVINGGKDCPPL